MKSDPRQLDLYPTAPDPGVADPAEGSPTIDRIAAVIGPDGALTLMRRFGGTRVYVPRKPRSDATTSPVVMALGWERADRLAAIFGGESIQVPLYKSRAARRRDRGDIIRLHREGMTVAAIARRVRCSERHVYNVLSGPVK